LLRGIVVPQPSLEVNPFHETFFDFFPGDFDDETVTTPETREIQPKTRMRRQECYLPIPHVRHHFFSIIPRETFGDRFLGRISVDPRA